jgi:lipoyl(octanoyl) transferase
VPDLPDDIEWRVSAAPVAYPEAVAAMEARAAAIAAGEARELIWLLEHPPIYTAGTSAVPSDLIDPRFPVFKTGRGGKYTYHGPGQRIGYVLLDLGRRGRDVRCYVHALEGWVIAALARFGIAAHRAEGRVGIWTGTGAAEAKIGAIGVRVRKWVTLHGFAVNIAPNLNDFGGIVPCGLPEFAVTSMAALGKSTQFRDFDDALRAEADRFLATLPAARQNEA